MNRNDKNKTLLRSFTALALALAIAAGCRQSPATGDPLLARVGDRSLYVSDLGSVITPGLPAQDSVKLLESYVDMWVRSELKIREAERRFRGDEEDIDAKVLQYRNSLLTYKLDQYFIEKYLDTTVTDSQIAAYYNDNKADLTLDVPVAKGIVVRLSDAYRGRDKLRALVGGGTAESRRDFIDICLKNNFTIHEWRTWTDANEIIAQIDVPQRITPEMLFSTRGVQEFPAGKGGAIYLVQIYDSRKAGEVMPPEMARTQSMIRAVLLNARRQEVIRRSEDTLLMQATARNRAKINIK